MRRRFVLVGIALFALAVFAVPVMAAPGAPGSAIGKALAAIRQATVGYQDVAAAEADGYVSTEECVAVPGVGGMGVHYANFGALFADPIGVDPLAPEVLLYQPTHAGSKLVGVEYVALALANSPVGPIPWFDHDAPPDGFANPAPEVLGQTLNGPMPGHGEGEPWHYELHVWAWQANPDGLFTDFNPTVHCPEE